MECAVTALVTCWHFCAARGRARRTGRPCSRILYRRGLEGKQLGLIVTDGCPGLAAAIQIVYPRARHQRCWVHKMRNISEKVRKCDHDEAKSGAQAIYLAESRARAEAAFRAFRAPPAGTRSAGTALLFCFSPTLVAQITHYECDRALLRGGATSHPADGLLCERRDRGPHHLLHLPAIQSGMENPHPLRIYTGSLTSPPHLRT